MTRLVLIGVVAVVLGPAPLGTAEAAQAGPGPRFTLTVGRHAVHGGDVVTVKAQATTTCTWLLEWKGQRRISEGEAATATFVAPPVGRPTRTNLHGTCFYRGAPPATTSAGGTLVAFVPPSWSHTEGLTVLPAGVAVSPPHSSGGHGHPGGLPGTGGPDLLALLAGLALAAGGTLLVRRSLPRASVRPPTDPRAPAPGPRRPPGR